MKQASLFSFFAGSKKTPTTEGVDLREGVTMGAQKQQQLTPECAEAKDSFGDDTRDDVEVSEAHLFEAAPISTPFSSSMNDVSDYEQLRQERIHANMAFLAQLGLDSIKQDTRPKTAQGADATKRRKRPLAVTGHEAGKTQAVATRRSTRSTRFKGDILNSTSHPAGDSSQLDAEDEVQLKTHQQENLFEETYFDDSSIYKYVLSSTAPAIEGSETMQAEGDGYPCVLDDGELSLAYSMHLHPRFPELLAAAGKNGRAAVYRVAHNAKPSGDDPVMFSFKAHSGWVSDILFVDTESQKENMLLLTSANDGSVKVWDLAKEQALTPQLLRTHKHLHRTGIFTMNVMGDWVLTGGKDTTVCVSRIAQDSNLNVTHSYQNLHSRVVKCVRWNTLCEHQKLFASSGDDCLVNVVDTRQESASVTLENVHAGSVHSLRWHPTNEHMLLTAGKDSVIHLYDIRQPKQPLQSFQGHVPMTVQTVKGIHHPEFGCDGNVVMAAGERSTKVTFFDTSSGRALSRGDLGSPPSCLLETRFASNRSDPGSCSQLIACALPHEGIKLLKPEYGEH